MADANIVPPKPKPRTRLRTTSAPDVDVQHLQTSPVYVAARSSERSFSERDNGEASSTTPHGATNTLRYTSAYAAERMHYTANTTDVFVARPLTSSVVGTIPQNELYGGHTANAIRNAAQATSELEHQLQDLRGKRERLTTEERAIHGSIELKKQEVSELEQRVRQLSEEESRLRQLCEEWERQRTTSTSQSEGKLREMERELQRRLDQVNDQEYANKQENMKLQRLADQLHMQKKDLDHREFDLENFRDDRPSVMEEKRAELMEREKRLHQQFADVAAKERDLEQRQGNFQRWMTGQEAVIQQRMSELGIGAPLHQSSPQHVAPSLPTHSSPYHPHNVTPSQHNAYTHQFQQAPASASHYTPQNVTPSQERPYTHQFTPTQYTPTHTPTQLQQIHQCPLPTGGPEGNLPQWGLQNEGDPYRASECPPAVAVSLSGQTPVHANSSGLNDLSTPPPQKSDGLPPGIIRSGSAGSGSGVSAVGVVSGGTSSNRQPSGPSINLDEEVAHHLQNTQSFAPTQTTDDISADEEYARQLQQELNATPEVDTDRELALALQTENLPSDTIPDLSSATGPGIQNVIRDTLKRQEEQKLQEQRDFELAQTLEGPAELNDLGS